MSLTVSFYVPGIPRPQGSKRAFVNRHTGKAALVESAGEPLKDWRGDVKRFAVDAMNGQPALEGPVFVALQFFLPRPKSHPKTKVTYPTSRPDADKLARGVLDALSTVCFKDDSQITSLHVHKSWGETPGCNIEVSANR